jgi:translation initiation factor IF-1
VGSSLEALKQTNITSFAADSASVDRSSKSKLRHQGLQLAIPGQSSYATVTKLLGDMRCDVELAVSAGTGPSVRCKIWGKVKGKSRRIKEGDAVLIAWRLCDSNRSTADILQKYTDAELQKLHMCRIWPHQIVKDCFDWVCSDQEQAGLTQQQPKQEYVCNRDMPSDSSEDSADEEGDDKVTWSMPMSSLALAEDLPSPKLKARKCEASMAPACSAPCIDLDLHDRYRRPYNPHYDIILQAYVDWWSPSKGTGYAIPVEPFRPKVRLTLEAFLNANMQRLDAGGMISVVIDSRHQFPYSLQIRPPASTEQPGPSCASTEQPNPSRSTVTLRAHVNWWSKDKGMGYATPAKPSSLAKEGC